MRRRLPAQWSCCECHALDGKVYWQLVGSRRMTDDAHRKEAFGVQ